MKKQLFVTLLLSSLLLTGCGPKTEEPSNPDNPDTPVGPVDDSFKITLSQDELFVGDSTYLTSNKSGNLTFDILPVVDDFAVSKDNEGRYVVNTSTFLTGGVYQITAYLGNEVATTQLTLYRGENYTIPEMDVYTHLVENSDAELVDLDGNPLTSAKVELVKKTSTKLNAKYLTVELTLNSKKYDLLVGQTVNGGREINLVPSTYVANRKSISIRPRKTDTTSSVEIQYNNMFITVTNPDYVPTKKTLSSMSIDIPYLDISAMRRDLEVGVPFNASLKGYDSNAK